jgi:40S ribosomal protein S4 C-terminus
VSSPAAATNRLSTASFTPPRFATRKDNVFVIGSGSAPMISLPKGHGIKQSIMEIQAKNFGAAVVAE